MKNIIVYIGDSEILDNATKEFSSFVFNRKAWKTEADTGTILAQEQESQYDINDIIHRISPEREDIILSFSHIPETITQETLSRIQCIISEKPLSLPHYTGKIFITSENISATIKKLLAKKDSSFLKSLEKDSIVQMTDIAEHILLSPDENNRYHWKTSDLPRLYEYISEKNYTSFSLDGALPAFLASFLIAQFPEKNIKFRNALTKDSFYTLPEKFSPSPHPLFSVETTQDFKGNSVQFLNIHTDSYIDLSDLSIFAIPQLSSDIPVVISGRSPVILFACITAQLRTQGQHTIFVNTPQFSTSENMLFPCVCVFDETKKETSFCENIPPPHYKKNILQNIEETVFPEFPELQSFYPQIKKAQHHTEDISYETFQKFNEVLSSMKRYFESFSKLFPHTPEIRSVHLSLLQESLHILFSHLSPHSRKDFHTLEGKARMFGALFKHFRQKKNIDIHEVEGLEIVEYTGEKLSQEKQEDILRWYQTHYKKNPDFAEKLKTSAQEKFSKEYTYFFLEFTYENTTRNIGCVRFDSSQNSLESFFPNKKILCAGGLHIDENFQSCKIMTPFFSSVLKKIFQEKMKNSVIIGYTEPNPERNRHNPYDTVSKYYPEDLYINELGFRFLEDEKGIVQKEEHNTLLNCIYLTPENFNTFFL
jgi:hypothetical protein